MPDLYKILIVFGCLCNCAFAQKSKTIIYKDTINITGYVYYDNGKPAPGTTITSKEKELRYNKFGLDAVTDDKGFFKLNGAKLNDTLDVKTPFTHNQYPNRGARYLIITVPTPMPRTVPTATPLTVTAVREKARTKTKFIIKPYPTEEVEIYGGYESMPEYLGGSDKFYKYLQSKLSYPVNAVKAGIDGTVEANFTIVRDGSISSVKIVKGLGYGCDELVLSILEKSPKWQPGRFYGQGIEVTYAVSVEFKLTNN